MKKYCFQMGAMIPGVGKLLEWHKGDIVDETAIPGNYLQSWIRSGIVAEATDQPSAPPAPAQD
jgi:hypothetical protein